MKKLLFLTVVLSLVQVSFSQKLSVDSLQKRIETLEEALVKENYVYVPKREYEEKLRVSVKDEIQQWVNSWRLTIITLWGVLSFLLGFLLKYFFTENYRKKIELRIHEETKELKERNNAFIKEITERFSDYSNATNKKYNTLSESFMDKEANLISRVAEVLSIVSSLRDKQDRYEADTKMHIENKINSTMGFVWDDIIDDNIRKAIERNYLGDDLIGSLTKLLESEDIKPSKDKKIELIDCIIKCFYYKKEIEGKLADEMIGVVEKYEKTLGLKAETFANIALKSCNYYEYYGTSKFKEATQLYCNKSINMLPDYGVPYTVLLELYMIDRKNSKNDTELAKAEENIQHIFKNINNNKSNILLLEIINRVKVDEKTYLKPYLDDLLTRYAHNFNDIHERAVEYLLKSYDITIKDEKYKAILTYILEYGLNTNSTIVDGTWLLEEFILSGIADPILKHKERITIKDFDFKKESEGVVENGIIYFLTATDPLALNLYFLTPFKSVKAIYKLAGDKLIMCLGPNGELPTDFLTSSENRYEYKVYSKVDAEQS